MCTVHCVLCFGTARHMCHRFHAVFMGTVWKCMAFSVPPSSQRQLTDAYACKNWRRNPRGWGIDDATGIER
jgi:hypothetical protein